MWHSVRAVVRREYLQRVRSKWFVFATLGAPLLMVGMLVVPALVASRGQENELTVALVDISGELAGPITPQLEAAGYTVSEVPWSASVVEELRARTDDRDLGGFIVMDEMTVETGAAVMYARDPPSSVRRLMIRSAIARAALEFQLEGRGVEPAAMLRGGDLRVEMLDETGSDQDDPQFMVAYVGGFFLYMVLLLYATSVMRAILEEKTSRIVEIIISSMKPWHLMLGKILGVGAVGLTQMAVWIGIGALVAGAGIPMLVAARPELASIETMAGFIPGISLALLFVGFFVCGYFMYAALYAAVGAMVSSEEEAQQAQFPMVMLLVVPMMFMMNVIENPSTLLATALSLFPLFSPVLMWGRVAGGGVPAWQVALSFLLMIGAVLAIAWVAGRIYKVGILMTGKRPGLPEIWRWVREG